MARPKGTVKKRSPAKRAKKHSATKPAKKRKPANRAKKHAVADPDTKRVRDPIHGLITFEDEDDKLVWSLLDCREFQRLRRIKQLGFSDLVYPGATHSRLAHSLGVFHNARRLLGIIKRHLGTGNFNSRRGTAALCAALLHDLGHGPFSHTFEGVQKGLGLKQNHEQWSAAIITGDSEIHTQLNVIDDNFADEVASIVEADEPSDVYGAVVSSQFDADRLDYLVRDRYMTGVEVGHFDLEWLFDCLTIGEIYSTDEAGAPGVEPSPGLVLNYKGFDAAVGYIQARQQLHATVYFHKTTRAAEKMLAVFLQLLARRVRDSDPAEFGLSAEDPVIRFLKNAAPSVSDYLRLDDPSIWSLLEKARYCSDDVLADLAGRVVDRKLYKCLDIAVRIDDRGSDLILRFKARLHELSSSLGLDGGVTLLEDDPKLAPYKWYSWDENTLMKVLVQDIEQRKNIDVGEKSDVIRALRAEELYRVYVPDYERRDEIEKIWREVAS